MDTKPPVKNYLIVILLAIFVVFIIIFLVMPQVKENQAPAPAIDQVQASTQAAMVRAFSEKYGKPADMVAVEVTEDTGEFARGSVNYNDEAGGGIWFAAKTAGSWQLAYDGNGIIDCASAAAYNLPTDMVPQCLDTAHENELVDRSAPGLIGGQTDDHGCLVAAGYSWCGPLDKCLRVWEEQCYTGLEQEVQYFLADKYDKPADEVRVAVTRSNAEHAAGSVAFAMDGEFGEGGLWLAAKAGNMWEVVYDGNGSVDCAKLRTGYGFSDEILAPNFCDALSE